MMQKKVNLKEKNTQQKLQMSTNAKGALSLKTSLLKTDGEWRWMLLLHCDTCR